MSEVPGDLKYAESHEWLSLDNDVATVGITDHAQALLGDLVYVELPEVGSDIEKGAEAGVVESVKAASDYYSPVSGKVVEVNTALEDSPELVNSDPYEDGWLFRIELTEASEVEEMLSAEDYQDAIED